MNKSIPASDHNHVESRKNDPLLTLESTGQRVQSDDDDDTRWDTRRRGPHSSLGLECRSTERTRRRVSVEQCTQRVVNTNSDELLVGVDLVPVQSAERFGDGDMFKKEDDDRDRQLGGEGGEEAGSDVRLTDMAQTRGDFTEDGDRSLSLCLALADPVRDGSSQN